jgi:predicted phage terminase large subunit-like protein
VTLPLFGINNHVPKVVRIRRLGPYFAQGRLRVRATPGGKQLIQEARAFPLGAHDDCLDAVEMGIRMVDYLLGRRETEGQPQVLRAS